MNKTPYQYIQNDLLTTPQNYQMSSYDGPDFLTSYQYSRRNINTELEKMPDIIPYSDISNKKLYGYGKTSRIIL